MEIAKVYNPSQLESKWYKYWIEHRYFNSVPDDREPYTVVIPPPNVTGVLHMGHMLNNTIQDILVRKARMEGKNACWVPGVDHASIATEAKVVQKLRAEGIKKSDLSRDEFMTHAWEWKNKHGGIILEQLKKLGASCDWERESFTMDPDYSRSVIDTFIDLYQKGLIYRGKRMVNWDPSAKTALSDEEVIHKEVDSKLYYVQYKIVGSDNEYVTIATTRPETILGDTAICVNPKDERFTHLHGKKAIVPLVNREVPIIADEYVDMEFGTGCLKITPAHDTNDYDLGKKHDLETIDVLNADGTMSEAAQFYIGEDRFEVRKKITKDLKESGNLIKEESYKNKVGYSERTDVPIEPRISLQWFVKMEEFSKPGLEHVMNDDVKFWPPKFKNSYRHWMENVKDWCISRQLWWGHRIPAFYFGEGEADFIIATSREDAMERLNALGKVVNPEHLKQDDDVLDTWFSSWLWPISVFNGFYSDEEIDYYYPTNDLVTAPEIMFFWVARMIIAGYEYRGKKPFENVYYTGIVRDQQGRKMSKSLGNSPDPIKLMEQYGADGVRMGMLFASPAGNDLLFDESLCEQGRNFSNKIWNALRLLKSWTPEDKPAPEVANLALNWMDNRMSQIVEEINEHYSKFRISDVVMTCYKFAWNDFCSWYLEAVKPNYGETIDSHTLGRVVNHFETLLKLLHPLTPFITEEIWDLLDERNSPQDRVVVARWPLITAYDSTFIDGFTRATELITHVRNIRKQNNIPNKVAVDLFIRDDEEADSVFYPLLKKLANIDTCHRNTEMPAEAFTFVLGRAEYAVPYGEEVDVEAQVVKMREELGYTRGFLKAVQQKLSNERFVNNAPDQVVQVEKTKEADALAKIALIEEKLKTMGEAF
ncbi:valine--tRNA ligase [Cryomorpha ignava]|uniref:Valine--tRNA ligase n=1 Tax=Cryomorpha ignava TaxID=101383 RepID=A0A7K3WS62_9FLAO|nr:valine--tRNA ligase [Cryomorpha ignava]NEN24519.1 valine--tRNA ligase [Cryomorpha ignava]